MTDAPSWHANADPICGLMKKKIFHKVKSLTAIECKLLVTGKERHVLSDGMGYDDVVTGKTEQRAAHGSGVVTC